MSAGQRYEQAIRANNINLLQTTARECYAVINDYVIDFDAGEFTPLGLAVQLNHPDCVSLLLNHGCDVTKARKARWGNISALRLAIQNQFREVGRILVHFGCRIPNSEWPVFSQNELNLYNALLAEESSLQASRFSSVPSSPPVASFRQPDALQVQTLIAQEQKRTLEMQALYREQQQQNTNLQAQLRTLQDQYTNLARQSYGTTPPAELQKQISKLQKENLDHKQTISKLSTQLDLEHHRNQDLLHRHSDSLQNQHRKYRDQIIELKAQLEHEKNRVTEISLVNSQLQARILELQANSRKTADPQNSSVVEESRGEVCTIHEDALCYYAKPVAQGSQGKILRANLQVAAKTFHPLEFPDLYNCKPNSLGFKQLVSEIHKEASHLYSLRHPNLLEFYGIVYNEDTPKYLITELAEGSLQQLLAQHPEGIPFEESCHIARQVVRGLQYLHSRQVCHRDLKPANVVYFPGKIFKIADFGVAKFMALASSGHTLVGTPFYCAPEVFSGNYSWSADIYSFGVIFLEILLGTCDLRQLDALLVNAQKKFPSVADLLAECLAKLPNERPSCEDILERLA